MSGWAWLWIAWIVSFCAIEGAALARKAEGDTLSEHVWKWFAIGRPGDRPALTAWALTRRIGLLAFLAWLAVHFVSGGVI